MNRPAALLGAVRILARPWSLRWRGRPPRPRPPLQPHTRLSAEVCPSLNPSRGVVQDMRPGLSGTRSLRPGQRVRGRLTPHPSVGKWLRICDGPGYVPVVSTRRVAESCAVLTWPVAGVGRASLMGVSTRWPKARARSSACTLSRTSRGARSSCLGKRADEDNTPWRRQACEAVG